MLTPWLYSTDVFIIIDKIVFFFFDYVNKYEIQSYIREDAAHMNNLRNKPHVTSNSYTSDYKVIRIYNLPETLLIYLKS